MWQLCGADPEKRFTWDMANNDNLVFDGFQPRARYDRFVFPGCLVGGHGGWSRCGRCFHVFAVYQFAIARLGAQAVLPALQRQVRPFCWRILYVFAGRSSHTHNFFTSSHVT